MTDSDNSNYDATRDPRTGRPPLPIDAEALREKRNSKRDKIEAEGEVADEANDEGINSTVARMKAPDENTYSDEDTGNDSGEEDPGDTLKKLWGDNLPENADKG